MHLSPTSKLGYLSFNIANWVDLALRYTSIIGMTRCRFFLILNNSTFSISFILRYFKFFKNYFGFHHMWTTCLLFICCSISKM